MCARGLREPWPATELGYEPQADCRGYVPRPDLPHQWDRSGLALSSQPGWGRHPESQYHKDPPGVSGQGPLRHETCPFVGGGRAAWAGSTPGLALPNPGARSGWGQWMNLRAHRYCFTWNRCQVLAQTSSLVESSPGTSLLLPNLRAFAPFRQVHLTLVPPTGPACVPRQHRLLMCGCSQLPKGRRGLSVHSRGPETFFLWEVHRVELARGASGPWSPCRGDVLPTPQGWFSGGSRALSTSNPQLAFRCRERTEALPILLSERNRRFRGAWVEVGMFEI